MAFFKQKFQTAEEIISVIEDMETEEAIDAVVIPPEVDELTDEEEIEDSNMILNEGGEVLPADVAGTFELHATLQDKFDISGPEPAESSEEENKKKLEQKKKPNARWWKRAPSYMSTPKNSENKCLQDIQDKFGSMTPMQIFELFLDRSILDEIVDFSTKYARTKNNHTFNIQRSELKKFIGILIFSSYHCLPQSKFYWSLDEDKGVPLVRKTMSRNRFNEIKKYIHLSDNSYGLDKSDKFSKIRPFLNNLNKRFLQFGIFSRNISIDEEMVPYFGRHSAKMFIKGKPVRFGFKLWCMASAGGYMFQFEPYGGASENTNGKLSLGERVITNFLKLVPDPENHLVFFDNFFTSHYLLTLLSEMKFFAAGTVRENRMASCPLRAVKELAKEPKGTYDYRFDMNNDLLAVRWRDNSVVTVLTNFGTLEPTIPVKRYNYKEKRHNIVAQPNIIHQYNKGMGGVDLHDNGVANYRIRVRGKKWWWPLFCNGIDSAIVNAWKMHQLATGSAITQVDFKSQIALCLMKAEEAEDLGMKTKKKNLNFGHSSKTSLPEGIRDDRIDHFIVRSEENARRRCKVCRSQTIYKCKKCQIHIHVECFSKFHE